MRNKETDDKLNCDKNLFSNTHSKNEDINLGYTSSYRHFFELITILDGSLWKNMKDRP